MTLEEAQQLRLGDAVLVRGAGPMRVRATVQRVRLNGKATRIDVVYSNGVAGSVVLGRVRLAGREGM